MGFQKNRLIETVLLSTHIICFGWEIRKKFKDTFLSIGLDMSSVNLFIVPTFNLQILLKKKVTAGFYWLWILELFCMLGNFVNEHLIWIIYTGNFEKNQSNNCEILMRIDHRCVNTLYIGKWRDLILNMAFDKVQVNTCSECKIVIIFLSINLDMCCGCSKEPSHWDSSFEYPQHMFWLRKKKTQFSIMYSYLEASSRNNNIRPGRL